MEFRALDEDSLEALAVRVASSVEPGEVIVLSGEVGAGKTTFVRAACARLGVEKRVNSPTYQIARSYDGSIDGKPVTVNHLDLYRLDAVGVEDALDLDEFLTARSVTFIEWAEPAFDAVFSPTVISFSHDSPETRSVAISGPLAGRLSEAESA